MLIKQDRFTFNSLQFLKSDNNPDNMGLGIKRKTYYILSCLEEVILKFNLSKYSTKQPKFQTSTRTVKWFVSGKELSDVIKEKLDDILHEANLVMQHKFNILGTGLQHWGDPIRWNQDSKVKREWPVCYYKKLCYGNLTGINGSDVKISWELSRFQHLIPLIKAFIITSDDKYASEAVTQIDNWIENNPFCYGVNWTCAMEVSIRSCNWIWAWWTFIDNPAWTDEFNEKFLKSMWQHGWYIEQNLEDKGGIRTNHYLADIVGLLFIGIMFAQFKDANRWKEFGIKELIRCMDEMVYQDGVSFENSTAYHRLVLEFFAYSAVLCQKNAIELPQTFWNRLEKMFEFVMHCMRPDGRMPIIGDSDDGRFFILANYYDWDRWDHRYLLSIGAVLFDRKDFENAAGGFLEEVYWILGERADVYHKAIEQPSKG